MALTSSSRSAGATPDRSAPWGSARPRTAIAALVGWTLLVWVGRVRNVLADDGLTDSGRLWRLALAGSFVALALALAGATWWPGGDQRPRVRPLAGALLAALAGWGIVVWLVRGTQILLGTWDLGFKVVHTVLAVVTVGLSAWVWQRVRRGPSPSGA